MKFLLEPQLLLIDSIIKANEKGKIKIKKIEDNTAAEVEILCAFTSKCFSR